jgi:hypothetical protein
LDIVNPKLKISPGCKSAQAGEIDATLMTNLLNFPYGHRCNTCKRKLPKTGQIRGYVGDSFRVTASSDAVGRTTFRLSGPGDS